jgi:hypothetical protein
MFHVPNQYRIKTGLLKSDNNFGNNGAFKIPISEDINAIVIASDGSGWEHVSLHIIEDGKTETPGWEEMCKIKDLFWDKEDCVVQYHPPESQYVNNHENVLHLWKPVNFKIPMPPLIMVGFKDKPKVIVVGAGQESAGKSIALILAGKSNQF